MGAKSEFLVAVSLGVVWGISGSRLTMQSVLAFLISKRTVPNVSAYRPDYLLQTVTDGLGVHPSKSSQTEDLPDGPLMMALGNGPKQD